MSRGRILGVLGLVLAVVLGAHLVAVILAAVVSAVCVALGVLAFGIAGAVIATGWGVVPDRRVVIA